MESATYLSVPKQRELLISRGIKFNESKKDKDIETLNSIGYYKLKEFAYPYSNYKDDNYSRDKIKYKNVNFETIISRYYQDKNLRVSILHALEDIEVYLDNQISITLSRNGLGAFGYLEYRNWCDTSGNLILKRKRNKVTHKDASEKLTDFKIEERQFYFKRSLLTKIKRSNLLDVKDKVNHDADGFPTVWIMVNCITFGDAVNLVKIMSKKNKQYIANSFDCNINELLSWIECLNLIRNICVHNSDLIDLELRTSPKVPKKYKDVLYYYEKGDKNRVIYSNKLAIIILIVKYCMDSINSRYSFKDIKKSLNHLIGNDDFKAHLLGFKDSSSYLKLFTNK